MKFTEWLRARQDSGNPDIDLVAPTMLEDPARWDRVTTAANAVAHARASWACNDEIAESVSSVFTLFLDETCSEKPPVIDPMGQPYVPGSKTTLADARLQLVCAALVGLVRIAVDQDEADEEIAELVVDVADATLKAMRG